MNASINNRKLKLDKLEKIKSRYKAQATILLDPLKKVKHQLSKSQQFSKIYNKLQGHFNISILPKILFTSKQKQRQKINIFDSINKPNQQKQINSKRIKSKTLPKSIIPPTNFYLSSKQSNRSISYNKIALPGVNTSFVSYHHQIKQICNQNNLPHTILLNKKFKFIQGLIEHIKQIGDVMHCIKRNLNYLTIISSIQKYFLETQKSDISTLDCLFVTSQTKSQCKTFLFLERFFLIIIVQFKIKKLKTDKTFFKNFLQIIYSNYLRLLIVLQTQGFEINYKKIFQGNLFKECKGKSIFEQNQQMLMIVTNIIKNNIYFKSFFTKQLINISEITINTSLFNILQFYSLMLARFYTLSPQCVRFLSTCPSPYLRSEPNKKYTLVLDMDQTLIHYNQSKLLIRPHCNKFLKQLGQYFQIGIFTCAMPDYADWVLNQIDYPLQFKFYRYHTVQSGISFFKDLTRLGRDLKKTIIVDNIAQNFNLTPKNGILIKQWIGDTKDTQLLVIMQKLLCLVKSSPEDIRNILPSLLQ